MKKITLSLIVFTVACGQIFAASFTDEEKANTFSAKEVEVMPVPVTQSQPKIPKDLKGIAGKVYVGFIVDSSGAVTAPRVLKSENDALNDVAVNCVAKWAFKPAEKGGSAVPMRVVVPIRFA